jgi:VanZ family protein
MPAVSQPSTLNSQLLRFVAWFAVLLWAATIYWFSSRTGPEIQQMNVFELWDKAAHFIAFFGGAVPTVCALRWTFGWSPKKVLIVSAITLSCYGAADEFHQLYTPGRSGADFSDWLADTLGAIAGTYATVSAYARRTKRRDQNPPGSNRAS